MAQAQAQAQTKPNTKPGAAAGAAATSSGVKEPPATKAAMAVKEVVRIDPRAISADAGIGLIKAMQTAEANEAKANALLESGERARNENIARVTQAILKGIAADKSIDVMAAFSGDKARQNKLNDQIALMLGIKEVVTVPREDGQAHYDLRYTKEAAKYFPAKGEDKNSAAYAKKRSLQTNLSTTLKKCVQSVAGIVDLGAQVKPTTGGVLAIEGPRVKEHFGVERVELTGGKQGEKQGAAGAEVELKASPSFDELRRIAEAKHGKPREGNTSSQASSPKLPDGTTNAGFGSIANALIAAINKISGTPSEAVVKHMRAVQSAIAQKLA